MPPARASRCPSTSSSAHATGAIRRAVALGLLAASPLFATAGTTVDRPDFIASSELVGAGRLQIGTGFTTDRDAAGDARANLRSTPTRVRMGVSNALELRIESDDLLRSRTQAPVGGATVRERGVADGSLGLKGRVRDGDGSTGTPGIAWLAHVDVDSGAATQRGQGLRPSLRLVAEWELPHEMSIGVTPGVALDHRATGTLAVTLGKTWSSAWRSFVELSHQPPAAARRGSGSNLTLDAGMSYLVRPDVQLDVALSRGMDDRTPDLQWGVGLSVRY